MEAIQRQTANLLVVYFISFLYYFGKSIRKMNDELQVPKCDFCGVQGIDNCFYRLPARGILSADARAYSS
jgi:hypothetical protein